MDAIAEVMEESGKTKADLARALGTSRAHITQVLAGSRNVTLGTVADLAWACGARVTTSLEPLRDGRFISSPVTLVRRPVPEVVRELEADDGIAADAEGAATETDLMAGVGG